MTVPLEEGHCWSCLHFTSFLLSGCVRKVLHSTIDLKGSIYRLSVTVMFQPVLTWFAGVLLHLFSVAFNGKSSLLKCIPLDALSGQSCANTDAEQAIVLQSKFDCVHKGEIISHTRLNLFPDLCMAKWQGLHGTKRFNVIITNSKIPRYANYSILAEVQFKKQS